MVRGASGYVQEKRPGWQEQRSRKSEEREWCPWGQQAQILEGLRFLGAENNKELRTLITQDNTGGWDRGSHIRPTSLGKQTYLHFRKTGQLGTLSL